VAAWELVTSQELARGPELERVLAPERALELELELALALVEPERAPELAQVVREQVQEPAAVAPERAQAQAADRDRDLVLVLVLDPAAAVRLT